MKIEEPCQDQLRNLIGEKSFAAWMDLSRAIELRYDMDVLWNSGGKRWTYEKKYSRGGKTLCALYAKENDSGFMIIFGKNERDQVDSIRDIISADIADFYDNASTYHDGKWVMFPLNVAHVDDYIRLLAIKRKPKSS